MSLCVCWTVCVIYVCNGHSRPFECFFIQVHSDCCGLTQISWIVKDLFCLSLIAYCDMLTDGWITGLLVVGKKKRNDSLMRFTILSSVILNWFLWYYDVCCQFHTNKLHCEKPGLLLDIATLTMCGRISVLMALIIYSKTWCLICKKRESHSMQMSYITGKGHFKHIYQLCEIGYWKHSIYCFYNAFLCSSFTDYYYYICLFSSLI